MNFSKKTEDKSQTKHKTQGTSNFASLPQPLFNSFFPLQAYVATPFRCLGLGLKQVLLPSVWVFIFLNVDQPLHILLAGADLKLARGSGSQVIKNEHFILNTDQFLNSSCISPKFFQI